MDNLRLISGHEELANHVNLGSSSMLVAGSTKCCGADTCSCRVGICCS